MLCSPAGSRPTKKAQFAITHHALPRGGFLFHAHNAYGSLNSPAVPWDESLEAEVIQFDLN
jgi:hypothetical protein